jgi:type II protein arginine methyltransferase
LGKKEARIIPAAASVRVALAYREPKATSLADVQGFDLSPFEKHFWPARKLAANDPKLSLRSEPGTLFHFDFQSGGPFPAERAHMTLTARGGPANGVVRWIRLELDKETRYENEPGAEARSHWSPLFWPLPGKPLKEGETIGLHAAHNREVVTLWVS